MNTIIYEDEKIEFDSENVKWTQSGISIFISGDENVINIGKGCQLTNVMCHIVGGKNSIEIGTQCSIKNTQLLLGVPANSRKVFIGDGTYIGGATLHLTSHNNYCSIGHNCMFSNEIIIRTEDGHPIYDLESKKLLNKGGRVVIGDKCWIGERVYILKGTELATGTIVGACSVLSKKIDEKCVVVVGNPAKIVKHNVGWNKNNIHNYQNSVIE